MNPSSAIGPEDLAEFRSHFAQNPIGQIAARAVSKTSVEQVCYVTPAAARMNHKFSIDIPTLPAANQNSSGRCWIFAALNLLREKIARDLDLEEFELSQSYISFYDHLEKANTFLEHILETAGEPLDQRYVTMLLTAPLGDGGWWEYFVGLCKKYGVCPKAAMPETYQSGHSETMNLLLNRQLRRDALTLRQAAAAGESLPQLRERKKEMLNRCYRILSICLGTPPQQFDFEYVDRRRRYHLEERLTPLGFYDQYLGQELEQIVSILNAPSPSIPFYQVYYTQGEESIFGAYQSRRLNLPMEEFKAAVLRQLEAGEPVWFVCDCDYSGSMEEGIWDPALYNCEELFQLDWEMDKGALLEYRQCTLNHAMLLTGVNLRDGTPTQWKIQNSWGEEKGRKGYFTMSDAWFDRYVFTASIHRRYLTQRQNELLEQAPVVLPPWNVLA